MKKLITLAALLCSAAMAQAEVTFTCTAGKNYGAGEGIDKLFDGNTGTKYCQNAGSDCYALVTASEPIFVWGYEWTTANDNEQYGRLITEWLLYGTNDEAVAADPSASGWVTLSNLGENTWIQKKNFHTQRFFCDKGAAGTAYKYFKVVISKGGFVQMSEFKFLYETDRVVDYNWKEGSQENSAKACDGKPNPKWEGGNLAGNWFTIESADGKAHAIKEYSFTTNDDGSWPNRAPKEWRLEGSNDNSSWVTIDEMTGSDPIANENFQTYTFTPANTTDEFRYLKVSLISMKGTGWTQIGEFHVLATSSSSDEEFYTGLVNDAKAVEYNRGNLSETDPWYLEYKTLFDGIDATLASCIAAGDYAVLIEQLDKMKALVPLMDKFQDNPEFVALDGTSCWGDGHYSQLLDGKDGIDGRQSTKWGGNFSGSVGQPEHVQYVIFRRNAALQPYFYRLVTGGDTKTQSGRNWKSWKVYGANFASVSDATYANLSNWTVLDSRENISAQYLPNENCYPAAFDFTEGVSQPYYYYMVAVTESNGSQQQMNEMYLCTQEEFESMRAPLVAYFDDFDVTRPVESDFEDELASFNEKFAELKTTADAVKLTLLYNECVALRTQLEASMDYLDFVGTTEVVDGVYQIGTAEQLVTFSKAVVGKADLKVALTADIDLEESGMAPIGSNDYPFKGTFDGKCFAVKNYTYENTDQNNVGLFGYINGATIQNVMLVDAQVNGNANAAGLVGNAQNGSVIQNCAVLNTYVEGRDHVAAIAGNLAGGSAVRNNLSDADIYSRSYQAGGMVGTVLSGAIVEKNLFTGTVKCNGGNASGLVSLIDADDANPTIKNNVVAAVSVEGGATFTLVNNSGGRAATYANNFILDTTVYSTGAKSVSNENDQNGKQISLSEATKADFYYDPLGWDMTNDWQYVARFVFPVLAYMDAVVPVEDITVTSAGYATYFTKAELDFGQVEGVEAYIPQLVNDEYVHLEPITYVPAGVGIVVKAAAGTYNIPYSRIIAKDVPSDLKAAPAGFTATGKEYILAKPEGEAVGFYKAEGVIAEGKGYIELTGASDVKALFFEADDATGIEMADVQSSMVNAPVYNLAGQRLSKAQKGVNIIGGKKILK